MIRDYSDLSNLISNHTLHPENQSISMTDQTAATEAASELKNQLNKEMMLFLSRLQPGDVLKGTLTLENGQMMLKMPDGMSMAAQCMQQAEIGKLQEFIVTAKGRQHLQLQLKQTEGLQGGMPFVDQAINELGLENTEASKNLVQQFVDKQMPLGRQELVKVLQLARMMKMPSEILTNLMSKGQQITSGELQKIADFKGNELKNMSQTMDQVLESVPENQKSGLIKAFLNTFNIKDLQLFLTDKGLLTSDVKGQSAKAAESLQGQTASEHADMVLNKEESGADQAGILLHEGRQQNTSDGGSGMLAAEEIRSGLLKLLDTKDSGEIKQYFKALLKEKMTVKVEDLEKSGEIGKIDHAAELIKKACENLKEINLTGMNYEKLEQMQQFSELLNKYNTQAQYFCFPMQVNGKEAEGELYFFKPKKNKKNGHQGTYIVLALDMPHLNKIEVHLKENLDKVDLNIKVKHPKIRALIEENKEQLYEGLEETGFHLGTITCQLADEIPSLEKEQAVSDHSQLSKLDARV